MAAIQKIKENDSHEKKGGKSISLSIGKRWGFKGAKDKVRCKGTISPRMKFSLQAPSQAIDEGLGISPPVTKCQEPPPDLLNPQLRPQMSMASYMTTTCETSCTPPFESVQPSVDSVTTPAPHRSQSIQTGFMQPPPPPPLDILPPCQSLSPPPLEPPPKLLLTPALQSLAQPPIQTPPHTPHIPSPGHCFPPTSPGPLPHPQRVPIPSTNLQLAAPTPGFVLVQPCPPPEGDSSRAPSPAPVPVSSSFQSASEKNLLPTQPLKPKEALYEPGKGEETDNPTVAEPALMKRQTSVSLPAVVEELAQIVAVSGDELEDIARERNKNTLELNFLHDKYSALYRNYRHRVIELKKGVESQIQIPPGDKTIFESTKPRRKRKSRWGDKDHSVPAPVSAIPIIEGVSTPASLLGSPGIALPTALGSSVSLGTGSPLKSGIVPDRSANPSLLAYAQRVFGSINLDEDQWKQCEDQLKV